MAPTDGRLAAIVGDENAFDRRSSGRLARSAGDIIEIFGSAEDFTETRLRGSDRCRMRRLLILIVKTTLEGA